MMRFAILGNSGSGKSTLAGWLAQRLDLRVLDLDVVAWEPGEPTVQRRETLVRAEVGEFCASNAAWVIEGCYANLVEATLAHRPCLVLLNPGPEACEANCRQRRWEPHKYATKEQQDARLGFLLSWVAEYYTRDGPLSLRAHRRCFDAYEGRKAELRRLPRFDPPDAEIQGLLR